MSYLVYGYASLALIVSGIFLGVFTLARNPPVRTPRLGMRGLKRALALDAGGSFQSIEPLMRMVAGWVAHLPLGDRRRKIDELLKHSGDWLGLTANEFVALSFLGFGVQPPDPSWGTMIAEGRGELFNTWWVVAFPAISLTLTVLAINLLSDRLRDLLDPRTL